MESILNQKVTLASDGSKSKIVLKLLESLVCTICHDYMYVPVMTTCGHNYCYNCISHWLVSNNATELTCPQCRSAIKEPPALNTALQQLCNMIIDELYQDNALLLETRMECTTQYKNDSNSSAMFNNVFGNTAIAVVDDDDGVARCSNCHWEVEGDVCPHCSYRMRNRVGTADENSIESDEYSEDELNELRNGNTRNLHGSVGQIYDLEAESDEDSESLSEGRGMRRQNSHNNNEEEEETDAYEREPVDSDLDSFIVDEDDGEGVELLDSDGLPEKEIHTNYGANSDTHESYDSDFYEHNDEGGFVSGDSLDDGTRSESEEHQEREEEDEDMGHQARKRRFQVVIDSDEED